ncbi:MAG: hypothetical protein K2P58_06525 [Hyphomonadaceae bacterium]|nr:hypothetical protein [Hyphomonadaceae bacterium]
MLAILLALQTAAAVVGFAYLWRRLRRNEAEIARLNEQLDAMRSAPKARYASEASAGPSPTVVKLPGAAAGSKQARQHMRAPSREMIGGLVLAVLAAAPSLGLALGVDPSWVVGFGVLAGAAMIAAAFDKRWAAAAWPAVITVAVWSALAFALEVDLRAPAAALCIAGVTGVVYARWRTLTPGGAMALLAALVLLFIGAQQGMISAHGAAFAIVVASAAVAGAQVRAEPLHLGAFAAALAGLFVLTGQNIAAVWFTPISAWMGALFFAVAAVRVPGAGSRGATLAMTGIVAPLLAVGMLHRANHALAEPWTAGLGFLTVALLASALLAATWRRAPFAKLGLTPWLLGLGAFTAFALAAGLLSVTGLATMAFGALAVGLLALDKRWPAALWRLLAFLAGLFSIGHALENARATLTEIVPIAPLFAVLAGPAAGAVLYGVAARLAARSNVPKPITGSVLEATSFALAMLAAHVVLRLVSSGGAPMLEPIGFFEACAHISVWLFAALLVAARSDHAARTTSAQVLSLAGLSAISLSAILWFTPYWVERTSAAEWHPALGFLLLSVLCWSHWALWRGRADDTPTRASLAAAGATMAGAAVLWLMGVDAIPPWGKATLSGLAITAAIALNFAPGVVAGAHDIRRFTRRSDMAMR